MLKELRKRFIIFNMLVITCVLFLLALFILIGSKNNLSASRFVPVIIISLLLVFAASYIISKFALLPIKRSWQRQLDFTADASHELRTPLTVIKTNLEIVLDSPDESVESQLTWLQNIEEEHTRMTKLVDNLLTLSRADTGEQTLFTSNFLIDEKIQTVVDTFKPVCQQKEIELNYNIKSNLSFWGDEGRISQLVVILLDNAVQYSEVGGTITVALEKKEKELELTVKDTGIGIGQNEIEKIFRRFYRVADTRQRNPNGSGLGLSIAKWIVEQHNGRIQVKSKPDEGTIFIIKLPI